MANHMPVVYVVDDEKVIAQTLASILNQAGFIAFAFEDPRQALAAAESGSPPNLLISDVMMPGMSGIEIGIQFRVVCPQCRILLFSGQAMTSNLLDLARDHGYDFELMSKPIHPIDLIDKLRSFRESDGDTQNLARETSIAPVGRQRY